MNREDDFLHKLDLIFTYIKELLEMQQQTGQDVLELPLPMMGKPVEVYIAVVSEDRSGVADSQYLGSL